MKTKYSLLLLCTLSYCCVIAMEEKTDGHEQLPQPFNEETIRVRVPFWRCSSTKDTHSIGMVDISTGKPHPPVYRIITCTIKKYEPDYKDCGNSEGHRAHRLD